MTQERRTTIGNAGPDASFGRPSLTTGFLTLAVGFSCYLACSVISSAPVFLSLPTFDSGIPEADKLATLFRILLLAGAALLYFKAGDWAKRWVVLVTGVAYAAGIFCAYAPVWLGNVPSTVLFVGSLLRGFHIILFLFWLDYLVHLEIRYIAVVTALGYGLSHLIYSVMTQLSQTVILQTLVVLPLLSAVCLISLPAAGAVDPSPQPEKAPSLIESLKCIPWKQFFGIGLFGIAVPLMMNITGRDPNYNPHAVSLVLAAFALVFALVLWIPSAKDRTLLLYRLTMPLLIVTTFVLYVFQNGSALETLIMEICWVFYRTMATSSWCMFARRSGVSTGFVLAVSQLVLTLCTLLRYVLNSVALALGWPSITILSIVAIIVVLVSAFMLSGNDYHDLPRSALAATPVAQAVEVMEEAAESAPAEAGEGAAPDQLEAFARLYRLSPQ
ncbi:MAG: hypothetical protein IKF96_07200, partial [Eggerthellaceae bacterium]|nr:hypothetical protein [Eggerthellaceae bacterium]